MRSDFLNKPYPVILNKWKVISLVSGFIFIFLIVFQPFGITSISSNHKTLILLGYGIVTGIALLFCLFALPLVFKHWFKEDNWTIKRHLIWMVIVIFSIGIGNFFYSITVLNFSFSLKVFLIFQLITTATGIIPVGIISMLKFNRLLKQNLELAQDVNNNLSDKQTGAPKSQAIEIISDNKKDKVSLSESDLLFIQSEGNYIQIVVDNEKKVQKSTIRCSLKSIENQLKDIESTYRCHRAFIVNLKKIKSLSGNAQGLRIKLNSFDDFSIPVSRSLSNDLKERLKNIH